MISLYSYIYRDSRYKLLILLIDLVNITKPKRLYTKLTAIVSYRILSFIFFLKNIKE
jgi:hypothetical protein